MFMVTENVMVASNPHGNLHDSGGREQAREQVGKRVERLFAAFFLLHSENKDRGVFSSSFYRF